jgi:hypothetical protein
MLVDYLSHLQNFQDGKKAMKTTETESEKPSYWQLIFMQSKVNGAAYTGEELPGRNWEWPKDTYLQRRLRKAKFPQPRETCNLN